MAKPGEVVQPGPDAQAVVDVHRRDIKRARALPECDHRDDRILQVFEQPRLVLHVAQQDDRVAMTGLEDHGQRDRFVGASMGVTEHDVVAVGHRLDRERLDRTREERVRDVADDGTEQHRGGAAQSAGERVRPISELASGKDHPSRVASAIGTRVGASFRTRETVLCETWAIAAMSRMRGTLRGGTRPPEVRACEDARPSSDVTDGA